MVAHWNHFWQSYVFSDLVVMGNMVRATILSLFRFWRNMVKLIILCLSHRGKFFLLMEVVSPSDDNMVGVTISTALFPWEFVLPEGSCSWRKMVRITILSLDPLGNVKTLSKDYFFHPFVCGEKKERKKKTLNACTTFNSLLMFSVCLLVLTKSISITRLHTPLFIKACSRIA
jgi:hypothetical protein